MKDRIALALVLLAIAGGAYGATFTVTNANDSGVGSLRWAIGQANATPGHDTITSSLGKTIFLRSQLPVITESVYLSFIGIDGSNVAGEADGLVIDAYDVSVYGLTVMNFSGDGIVIRGEVTHLSLVSSSGNRNGVRIETNALIEGSVFLSNRENGIWITSAGSASRIGFADDEYFIGEGGEPPFGNGVWAAGNGTGIRIDGDKNFVFNVHVGLAPPPAYRLEPNLPMPNRGDGIIVSGAHNTVSNSTMSNSGGHGMLLLALANLENNAGSCNAGGFIVGSLIEPPQVAFARADPTAITASGAFQGEPNASYRIGLVAEAVTCPDVGMPHLGTITVTTNAAGYASWTAALASYLPYPSVAAIATRGEAEVSRLSNIVAASVTGEKRSDLKVQTSAPANATVDQLFDFVTEVTNTGPATIDGFVVRIPHTRNVTRVSFATTSGSCYLDGLESCYIGTLALGETATIRERVRVSASGTLQHVATVEHYDTASPPRIDPNLSNNTAIVDVVATPPRGRAAGH